MLVITDDTDSQRHYWLAFQIHIRHYYYHCQARWLPLFASYAAIIITH
jgi:hypothetical protein